MLWVMIGWDTLLVDANVLAVLNVKNGMESMTMHEGNNVNGDVWQYL